MDQPPIPEAEARNLRFLRLLVTVLTAVMILGLVTVVALLVIRLQAPAPETLPLPDSIALPDGARAQAFTQGRDWYAVVTAGDEILIFDRATGALRQRVEITPAD
ncbi:DUF6476 family protein [Palleronia sp. KMU-117]|uniref:DUF6476 family protein n=1 Tax=Palleronia sp. KMU-117 TaxID=3434108 RepID=UPI003D748B0F